MENTTNRNDVNQFFKDMPKEMQIEAINKLQSQIKKPPELTDINAGQSESEVVQNLGAVR